MNENYQSFSFDILITIYSVLYCGKNSMYFLLLKLPIINNTDTIYKLSIARIVLYISDIHSWNWNYINQAAKVIVREVFTVKNIFEDFKI